MLERVYFEYCRSCSSHQWCTKHDESKYQSYYARCVSALQEQCPELEPVNNEVPVSIQAELSNQRPGKLSFPRIGSFEVYFRGKAVFSKLTSGSWPNPLTIAQKIRTELDTPAERPSRRTKKRKVLRKRQKQKRPQSTCFSSPKKRPPRSKTTVHKTRNPRISTPDHPTPPLRQEIPNDKPKNKFEFEKNTSEFDDPFRSFDKNSQYSNEEFYQEEEREVTKKYEIKLPLNSSCNKKIAYRNETNKESEFFLYSNDPAMVVKENVVLIHPGERGKFKLKFEPVEQKSVRRYLLNIDLNGKPWETMEFIVHYE